MGYASSFAILCPWHDQLREASVTRRSERTGQISWLRSAHHFAPRTSGGQTPALALQIQASAIEPGSVAQTQIAILLDGRL